jgi:nicotinamide mononucleotide adenylyltransferase
MNKPYNCFIGRYQCPHKGHQTIFNEYLSKGEPILIMIRDVPTDEKNPFLAEEVKILWEQVYKKEVKEGLVKIMIIPDIASVNYGRGVGYEVKEIQVNSNIANISATEIRSKIRNNDDSWKELVDDAIHYDLTYLLTGDRLNLHKSIEDNTKATKDFYDNYADFTKETDDNIKRLTEHVDKMFPYLKYDEIHWRQYE